MPDFSGLPYRTVIRRQVRNSADKYIIVRIAGSDAMIRSETAVSSDQADPVRVIRQYGIA